MEKLNNCEGCDQLSSDHENDSDDPIFEKFRSAVRDIGIHNMINFTPGEIQNLLDAF